MEITDINSTAQKADSRAGHEREKLTLASLPIGVRARIVSIDNSNSLARRLIEMGIVPGVRVEVVKTAPFGDPLQIFVRSYHLALRRAEALTITVCAEAV